MSSAKSKEKKASPRSVANGQNYALPEGYQERSDELEGFWSPELGPIHFIPEEAVVNDSKLEKQKQSGLIRGTLVDDCSAMLNSDGEPVTVKAGARIGVWAKPDMRPLKQLAGVKVFMFQTGERDVGKPNPMATFKIASSREGDPLPVTDARKLSKGHASWLAPAINPSNGAVP